MRLARVLLGSAVWGLAAGAAAQPVPTPPVSSDTDAPGVVLPGEIIITAQKRAERLEDVPVAVTVVTGDQLVGDFLTNTADLQRITPTLTFGEGSSPGTSSIKLRGIGTTVFDQNVEPTVSVVVDGVVLSRNSQGFVDLIDIDRVEVLKGPQGTLFGKNASGGVVNIVTARPSDRFSLVAEGIAAANDEYQARASLSGPLAPNLGGRLTGFYKTIDGNILNVVNGERLNGAESWGVRGKLEFEPRQDVNIYLIADYRELNSNASEETALFVGQDGIAAALARQGITPGERNTLASTFRPTVSDSKDYGVSLQIDVDAGPVTVTSQTAYREFGLFNSDDVDLLANDPSAIGKGLVTNSGLTRFSGIALAGPLDIFQTGDQALQQFSQEVRVTSLPGRLEYVAGLFAFVSNIDNVFTRTSDVCFAPAGVTLRPLVAGAPCVPNGLIPGVGIPDLLPFSTFTAARGLPPGFGRVDSRTEIENYAAFAQGTFDIVGGLGLIGGLRLQHDVIDGEIRQDEPTTALALTPTPFFRKGRIAATALSGKAGVQYDTGPTLFYATYSRGYKGPTLDFDPLGNQVDVDAETSNNYEVGIKGALFDRRVNFTLAGFWTDYSDFQAESFDPTTGFFVINNVGAVRSRGVEADVSARLFDGFTLVGGAAYVDATVTDFPNGACLTPVTSDPRCDLATRTANLAGDRLANAPEFKGNLTADYEVPVGRLKLGARATFTYQSETQFALPNNPLAVQDGYGLLDASVRLADADDRYVVSLFARNLTDTFYRTSIFQDFTSLNAAQTQQRVPQGADRRFGVSLRVNVGGR